ncbi:MAG: BatA domain-containing protein [Pseudoxanthomonas sp.]
MSLSLLLPAALAALATLLLPLLLHLTRRSEEKRVVFAALRWLREKPRPRRHLRFDEWWLLALRLFLLAALALWLARPILLGAATDKAWVVAMHGVEAARVRELVEADKSELHWLAPGFPEISATQTRADDGAAFPSLLRELDAQLPADTRLTVIVPERLAGADAQRPRLSRTVDWKIVPGDSPKATTATPALQLDLSPLPADAVGLEYLHAVNAAWGNEDGRTVQVRVLLADQPAPADLQLQPAWRDAQGDLLVEVANNGQGPTLRFTRNLQPASMPQLLEADFPQRLREAVLPAPAPTRAFARDYAPTTGTAAWPQTPRELQPWLALLIALLFLVERWMATSRRRGTMP